MGEEQKYGKIVFTDSNGKEYELKEISTLKEMNSMQEMAFRGVDENILTEYEGECTIRNEKLYYFFKRQLREWKRERRRKSKWNKYRIKRANKLKSDIVR